MTSPVLTRRQFVGASAATFAGLRPEAVAQGDDGNTTYRLFWGDLHNHNAVGYGKGSLERSIELARNHLDFFAFTGHAAWHDLPKMPGDRHLHWVRGFEAHGKHWPKTRELIRAASGKSFLAFLGYEWHSSAFGDYCLIFPDDQPELFLPDHVKKLHAFAAEKKALAITHHIGYKLGWRGANFEFHNPAVSPVVEIFSEHGCTESDRAPFPMLRHSNGGRATANTVQAQLAKGLRFGFVASSDNHAGYPAAYGEGVVGVWAKELTHAAVLEAVRARRTYAATGDRITLDVKVNGRLMGSELPATADRQIDVKVDAQDSIAMIELIKNGKVIDRSFPEDRVDGPPRLPGAARCRVQFGWGPWGALALERVCPWDFTLTIKEGKFLEARGCFQWAPFDENFRDKLDVVSDTEIRVVSQTTRKDAYGEDPTKSVVLQLSGGPDAVLTLDLKQPAKQTVRATLAELCQENVVTFTGGFTTESHIIGRLIGPREYQADVRFHDKGKRKEADYYYVRVTQHNGHMAWSSPVWVG